MAESISLNSTPPRFSCFRFLCFILRVGEVMVENIVLNSTPLCFLLFLVFHS